MELQQKGSNTINEGISRTGTEAILTPETTQALLWTHQIRTTRIRKEDPVHNR